MGIAAQHGDHTHPSIRQARSWPHPECDAGPIGRKARPASTNNQQTGVAAERVHQVDSGGVPHRVKSHRSSVGRKVGLIVIGGIVGQAIASSLPTC